jgi:serine/threonine protein phosphatase PrpC
MSRVISHTVKFLDAKLLPGIGFKVVDGRASQDVIAICIVWVEVDGIRKKYIVLAVFDGHGGKKGKNGKLTNEAALAGARVINSLSDPNNKYGLTGVPDVVKILEAIHEEFKASEDDTSGSTATIVVIDEQNNVEGRILGDSAIRINRDNKTVKKYTGASPNDKATRDQVIARGGEVIYFSRFNVWRLVCDSGETLATSSGVGDYNTRGVDREGLPVKFQLAPNETLLIGSDGLDEIDSRTLDLNLQFAKEACKGNIQQTASMFAEFVYRDSGGEQCGADDVAVILYQPDADEVNKLADRVELIASESAAGP